MNKNERLGCLILAGLLLSTWAGFTVAWWVGILLALSVLGFFGSKIDPESNAWGTGKQKSSATIFENKKEITAIPCDISGNGGFDYEVVGESHYQDVIAWSIPLSYRLNDKFRLYTVAAVYQDDDNDHDKNAVAVQLGGDTAGHFARADAKRFRKWATKEGLPNPATCRAIIVRNNGSYGIWLDLPITNSDY